MSNMSESYVTNNVKPTNFKSDNNDYLCVRLFARMNCFARVPACLIERPVNDTRLANPISNQWTHLE